MLVMATLKRMGRKGKNVATQELIPVLARLEIIFGLKVVCSWMNFHGLASHADVVRLCLDSNGILSDNPTWL